MKIAVVGCGPGGMATALFLNRLGHQITLFERFDNPQPIGSGLLIQPSGQAVLNQLGLLDRIRKLGHPVNRLRGVSLPSGKRALDMEYRYGPEGIPAIGIHRASLFSTMFEAVSGTEIALIRSQKLAGFQESDRGVIPQFESRDWKSDPFDLMIDASGARSPLASGTTHKLPFGAFWTNVDIPSSHDILPNALDQRYFHAEKMAGIMPIGVNPATGNSGAALFWSEKPDLADDRLSEGIDRFQSEFCALWPEAEPFVSQIGSMDDLTMAIYHHRTGKSCASKHVLFVGDSWHCTSPQLGQGANMALIDAQALSAAVSRAHSLPEIAAGYARARRFHIGLYQLLSRMFTPLYQSENRLLPLFRDFSIHYFAGLPGIRQFIAKTVSGGLGL